MKDHSSPSPAGCQYRDDKAASVFTRPQRQHEYASGQEQGNALQWPDRLIVFV
jgi:hypothetical protein